MRQNLFDFCRQLPKFSEKAANDSGQAQCEIHPDHNPSLFLKWGQGRGYFKCLACNRSGTLDEYAQLTGRTAPGIEKGEEIKTLFTYRWPDGRQHHQVTRIDYFNETKGRPDKKIFQARWEKNGWVKKSPETRLLYNAQALAEAQVGTPVFIVEGEKCAEHLIQKGLLATTAPGGAGNFGRVCPDSLELLVSLGPIILPDNDEPGFSHALEVVNRLERDLSVSSRVLILPGLQAGEDVADWLCLPRGRGSLLDLIPQALSSSQYRDWLQSGAATRPGPVEPEPVTATPRPVILEVPPDVDPIDEAQDKPTFRLDLLPSFLGEFVSAVAESYQVPPSYPLSLALAALSTATLKRAVADPGRGPTAALNAWFLTSMESGSGKTSTLDYVFSPIRQHEYLLMERHHPAEGETENLVGIYGSDCTPEALEKRMKANDGRWALANAEAADLFAILAGKYSQASVANIGLFLKGYSGEDHVGDRVLRGASVIREPRLTLSLALQPRAFADVMGKVEFRDRGLLARFFLDAPDSILGYRKIDTDRVPATTTSQWAKLLYALLQTDVSKCSRGQLVPHRINFAPRAVTQFREFRVWAEEALRPDGYFEANAREFGARAAEHTLKLAGLLHCAQHALSGSEAVFARPLTVETLEGAIGLFHYYAENVRLASQGNYEDRCLNERLRHLLKKLQTREEWKSSFKARDLYQAVKNRRGYENMRLLLDDLEKLTEHGFVRELPQDSKRGRPSATFEVLSLDNAPKNTQNHFSPITIEVSSVPKTSSKVPQNAPNIRPRKSEAEIAPSEAVSGSALLRCAAANINPGRPCTLTKKRGAIK